MRSTTQTLQHNKREKSRSPHVTHFQHFKSNLYQRKKGGLFRTKNNNNSNAQG